MENSYRRAISKPISMLESDIENLESELRNLVTVNPVDYSDNIGELQNIISSIKKKYDSYSKISRILIDRLTKSGSIANAMEYRKLRLEFRNDITEIIKCFNIIRNDLNLELESSLLESSYAQSMTDTINLDNSNYMNPDQHQSPENLGQLSSFDKHEIVQPFIEQSHKSVTNDQNQCNPRTTESPFVRTDLPTSNISLSLRDPTSFGYLFDSNVSRTSTPILNQSTSAPLSTNQHLAFSALDPPLNQSRNPFMNNPVAALAQSSTPVTEKHLDILNNQPYLPLAAKYPSVKPKVTFATAPIYTIPNSSGNNPTNNLTTSSNPIDFHDSSSNVSSTSKYSTSLTKPFVEIASISSKLNNHAYHASPITVGRTYPQVSISNQPHIPSHVIKDSYSNNRPFPPSDGTPLLSYNNFPAWQVSNATTQHLLRQELFKKSMDAFSGDPHKYHTWTNIISHKIKGLELEPWDILTILHVNTTGKPQKLIETHMAIGGADPHQTLKDVWESLREQFGSGARIATSLMGKVDNLPQIKSVHNSEKMSELISLCQLILCNMSIAPELQIFNLSIGIRKIWLKLADSHQNSWRSVVTDYKAENCDTHPPFKHFVNFLIRKSKDFNDPCYEKSSSHTQFTKNCGDNRTLKTNTDRDDESYGQETFDEEIKSYKRCCIHPLGKHSMVDCNAFAKLSHQEKRSLLMEKGKCFQCLGEHLQTNCDEDVQCSLCNRKHVTVMHRHQTSDNRTFNANRFRNNGGQSHNQIPPSNVSNPEPDQNSNLCTRVCGNDSGRNCSKVILVDLTNPSHSTKIMRCYCILDEQSSSSFIDPRILDFFKLTFPEQEYTLTTLSGLKTRSKGMIVNGFRIKGVLEKRSISLPDMFTNDYIPDCRHEVATPEIVRSHKNISHFANNFPAFDINSEVLLLVGRDCGSAMATKCFGYKAPFVHHTSIGWALVGSVCPNNSESPNKITLKTYIQHEHLSSHASFLEKKSKPRDSYSIFREQTDDELEGFSREDQRFLSILTDGIHINDLGNITMPLPFKSDSPSLPNNRYAVLCRTTNTLQKVKKDSSKLCECIKIMENNLLSHHVEPVPSSELSVKTQGKVWYIPVFPVCQQKKGKIRLVYDSSAVYHGTSLNQQLLQGPDVNNQLRTVLMRFRKGVIGFTADIEAMFHAFHLPPSDKDYTRFFWWENNDPNNKLVEYRAKVHIFGNRSSPALANIGLRFAANQSRCSTNAREFIDDNFYVDDACGSADTINQTISTLNEARKILDKFNIRLHKICSNSSQVLETFPPSEISKSSSVVNLHGDSQQTLGLEWNTKSDTFIMKTNVPDRPFTKRGVLATLNSTFDPLGFLSPLILTGRLIQRLLIPAKKDNPALSALDWDDPLPSELNSQWEEWKKSLRDSNNSIPISRCYYPSDFGKPISQTLHVFSDASTHGTGYVIYMRSVNHDNDVHISLVSASSKIAPRSSLSIPRLELCAAVDATIAAHQVLESLQKDRTELLFYCDSKVVLGYIKNTNKRFTRYVSRRVDTILKLSSSSQWKYIRSDFNPADAASRPQTYKSLTDSCWFRGPPFLWDSKISLEDFECDQSTNLPETVEPITVIKSTVTNSLILHPLCERVGSLNKLLNVLKIIVDFIFITSEKSLITKHTPTVPRPLSTNEFLIPFAIRLSQIESFPELFNTLGPSYRSSSKVPHKLLPLSPYIDANNSIRVGGRLHNSHLPTNVKHPFLIPSSHPIAQLIIGHFHTACKHQGRHITHGCIRNAGYFIQNGSKIIRKFINDCITCRKLRGFTQQQMMCDLPEDRLHESPPFTYCGMDVFGPYMVSDGKSTRNTVAEKKSWGLVFTCLVSRAIHIELLPSLDTPTFKNALRRFFCVRGTCRLLRSDQGTNFIGARNEEHNSTSFFSNIKAEFSQHQCKWELNPPKASHFGGVWERKISSIKRIIDACLLQLGTRRLSRDELQTFFQESASIINNTPMWEISFNANEPFPLTPAMLMTLKDNPNPPPLESFDDRDLVGYGTRRYRRAQYLSEQFWQRWRNEYVHRLLPRNKWTSEKKSLCSGDVVLVKDKNLKRNSWPLARVSSVRKSKDGLVRSVTLMFPSKNGNPRLLDRPVCDIILLLNSPQTITT